MNHTATPWQVNLYGSPTPASCPVVGPLGYPDGIFQHLEIPGISDEERMANADFIVRAVNAHEQLVAALETIAAGIGGDGSINVARTALAQAEEPHD